MKSKVQAEELSIDLEDISSLPSLRIHKSGDNGNGKCPHGIDEKLMLVSQNFDILHKEQKSNFDHLHENINNIRISVDKINDTILNPESGLYSRVKSIEGVKGVISKIIWLIMTSAITFVFTKMVFFK